MLLVLGALATLTACEVPGERDVPITIQPGSVAKTVTYGPYTIPAGATTPDGKHGEGMIKNEIVGNVEKPCTDCYITSMHAELKYLDGRIANIDTNAMLHHMVLADTSRPDVTCPSGLFNVFKTGERFFASGNERTLTAAPEGYGYPVDASSSWLLIYDLMNSAMTPQDVVIDVRFTHVPRSTPGIKPLTPVWFDIDQCGDSELPPKATPQYNYEWTWKAPFAGHIVGMGGHLHDGGDVLSLHNDTKGNHACNSVARYGQTPGYVDHHGMARLSTMSVCWSPGNNPLNDFDAGDALRIDAKYDTQKYMAHGDHDIMGIMIVYVSRSD